MTIKFNDIMKKFYDDEMLGIQQEDAPANSVAGGGVDMNPTGGRLPKMDKRRKHHPDAIFRRTKRITDGAIDRILKLRNA